VSLNLLPCYSLVLLGSGQDEGRDTKLLLPKAGQGWSRACAGQASLSHSPSPRFG